MTILNLSLLHRFGRFARRNAFVLIAAAFAGGCLADELPELGEAARAELSPQMERKIGESIMNEIRQREPSYIDDPEVNDYLGRIGRRLVESSANPTGDFHFFAIRDNSVNAFAMFGGFIGVNTGTMLTAQTESELSAVMAHEIAHVTQNHLARQIAKQKQNTIPSMVAMAVGILLARSNSSAAMGTMMAGSAGAVQAQLAYTRDFEREADRMGYQTLDKAGFDVRGMGDFFSRLQTASRLYENNAPVYLRSHPLTLERLSDMQNRSQESPYRQVVSSLDFYLVRAKLRAFNGTPREAVADFETLVREKKYVSAAAARYGLAEAQMRAKNYAAAQREMDALHALKLSSPLIAGLAGEIRLAQNDAPGAVAIYREALQRFPGAKSLVYGYAEALYAARQFDQVLSFLESQVQFSFADATLYALQAKTYAALGKRLQQHRAQAETYVLRGQLGAAVEQLQFAQQAADGNFYEQSAVDARLRELRALQADEAKQKKSGW
ncbi:Putative Zn-dependent protease, contains TPR repeats [Propionivibrio dicarboxylicus]|uniref:Putative Zn-dependent protease, contains TPR repeats n=1 Tax=Propionivibrio dicarboxylicus TaxID=83767 RepID=A0A1G8NIG3_9RHOO|nr:Putative Zn-dependent protease, contains TPR repeats [Propionivibrio dicarboxylicus]